MNGCPLGEKEIVSRYAEWKVVFEKGELSVRAKKGQTFVFDKVKTAGTAEKIILEDVAEPNNADNLHIINATVVDADNVPVPGFCEEVEFDLCDGNILGGRLPNKQEKLVLAWIEIHKDEIKAAWDVYNDNGETKYCLDKVYIQASKEFVYNNYGTKEDDILIANNEELKKFAEIKEDMKSDNIF